MIRRGPCRRIRIRGGSGSRPEASRPRLHVVILILRILHHGFGSHRQLFSGGPDSSSRSWQWGFASAALRKYQRRTDNYRATLSTPTGTTKSVSASATTAISRSAREDLVVELCAELRQRRLAPRLFATMPSLDGRLENAPLIARLPMQRDIARQDDTEH